jgi:Tol biopolymer transport system component
LLPATGGTPRKVETGFKSVRFSAWSPDGKTMLFRELDLRIALGESKEIYAIPRDGGTAVSTGVAQAFRARGVELEGVRWLSDRLIATGSAGDAGVIEEFRIQKDTWRLDGSPRRILALPGADINVAATDTGPTVFSSVNRTTDIWSIPVNADAGKVLGEPENLTNDAAHDYEPSLSADGKRMVFVSDRTGRNEVWLRDLTTRKETQLTATPEEETRARISPDGAKIAYEMRGKPGYILAREIDSHEPLTVCRDCSNPRWTPDSERITYYSGNPILWQSLHFRSGDRTDIVSHPKKQVQGVRFSPDGHWISFSLPAPGGLSQIFVSSVKAGKAVPEAEWIPITDPKLRDYYIWWSPNGNLLYFLHWSGSDYEIAAQPLDPGTKRPKGALIHVYQPKAGHQFVQVATVGLSLSANRLVVAMSESKGNLWKLDQKKMVQ